MSSCPRIGEPKGSPPHKPSRSDWPNTMTKASAKLPEVPELNKRRREGRPHKFHS
jgi:hypothetical protein